MLEVISIHINKTAGKSFRCVLENNYAQNLFCINTDDSGKQHRSLSCRPDELANLIPSSARALHGHFFARDIISIADNLPIVAWIRNPVDRVVSNYFHDWNNRYTNLFIKEYILQECNINRMSKMLYGICLDKLTIGLQENFSADVIRIGKIFGWKHLSAPMINVGTKHDVSKDMLGLIEDVNHKDIELYNDLIGSSTAERPRVGVLSR